MTESAYIDIQFKGNGFCPGVLAEKLSLPIETLVSSGELGKVGRYKGKPVPYGIGLLKINPNVETIDSYSDLLLKNKSKLKKYNVDEIIFDVDANSYALEMISISNSILKKLSSLNARIQFHNHEIVNNDFELLISKLITKVSTSSHPNKKKIENFFRSTASTIEIANLTTEYTYAIIISLIENTQSNKKVSQKSLDEVVEEFDKI